ncbi:MAG: DUF1501 domain-containing protein [Lentisphaeraceae bacterium]|nr:DUF1501 domain-containing protein [Lentisphaeraceae bacterium]
MINRRDFLKKIGGVGALTVSGMATTQSFGAPMPLAPKNPHFAAKAKSVIFLYMDGGVSQVDSFDPKPLLNKLNGQKPKFKVDATVFNNNGNILQSPWEFKNYGQSGLPISDLFPNLGKVADDLCVIRSMTAFSPNHPNATYALHSGHVLSGRPSMGAWLTYGLGTENQSLPGFMVLHGGQVPSSGMQSFTSGFLPANYQGSTVLPGSKPLFNVTPLEKEENLQSRKLSLLKNIDQKLMAIHAHVPAIESAVQNYELAYKMQSAIPEAVDLSKETAATKKLYGLEHSYKNTKKYGAQCLIARRMVERGVRFIELTINGGNGDRWDQHSNLKEGHERNAMAVDQPISALIQDLKSRGLLDSTLIVFCGEFGRTPFAQGKNGRDHNPQGFSMWMAGGGIKGGTVYGSTDEFGYRVIENKMTVHDLHANMLHLTGIDHTKLTYRYGGRDVRLTDVHGEIIPEILS